MSDAAKGTSKRGGAYRAGWHAGRDDGRKEERARIRAQVQSMLDLCRACQVTYGHEVAAPTAFDIVLQMMDQEDTSHA